MPDTYEDCLWNSYRVNWRIRDVLGDRRFDPERPWLPSRLSGAGSITCLSAEEKRKLTHVEMGAYAHVFAFVEEFIAPKMASLGSRYQIVERDAFDALTNFAAEEVKHMRLFREVRDLVDDTIGRRLALLRGEKEVANLVLQRCNGAVLLLTSFIEWFTQLHYVGAFKDDRSLDPLTKEIFRCHWLEESQHARMDVLETRREFDGISEAGREQAVNQLVELVASIDRLLQTQAHYDVENLGLYLDRRFDRDEEDEIFTEILKAKRYTFIESGVTHPNFQDLLVSVTTPEQRERVAAAVGEILVPVAD